MNCKSCRHESNVEVEAMTSRTLKAVEEFEMRFNNLKKQGQALERACTKPSSREYTRTLWAVGAPFILTA